MPTAGSLAAGGVDWIISVQGPLLSSRAQLGGAFGGCYSAIVATAEALGVRTLGLVLISAGIFNSLGPNSLPAIAAAEVAALHEAAAAAAPLKSLRAAIFYAPGASTAAAFAVAGVPAAT